MYETVIVGGGVVGLLTAFYLQKEQSKVCIIDRSKVGSESSWAGGGIISPLYPWLYDDAINELSRYGQRHYEKLADELRESTGIDPQWRRSGLVMLDLESTPDMNQWQKDFKQSYIKATASELQDYEPRLNSKYRSGWIQKDISQLRNPWMMRSLRQYLENKGVIFKEKCEITEIMHNKSKIIGVKANDEIIESERVIIASGAWSGLFKELDNIDVKPVMGQMILYKTKPQWLQRIVMKQGKYVIPRADGHILCGSTLEYSGYNKVVTRDTRRQLKKAAEEMLPELKEHHIIKQWSGLRPGSPNGVPYIGMHETIDNLYINTGHYRYGVVMGLGSARLLTDIVVGHTPSIVDPAKYALSAKRVATAEYQDLQSK